MLNYMLVNVWRDDKASSAICLVSIFANRRLRLLFIWSAKHKQFAQPFNLSVTLNPSIDVNFGQSTFSTCLLITQLQLELLVKVLSDTFCILSQAVE